MPVAVPATAVSVYPKFNLPLMVGTDEIEGSGLSSGIASNVP